MSKIQQAVSNMESESGISPGLLSGIFEHKTGWRAEQSVLPQWRNTAKDKPEEIAMSALRLQDKALEFDGIVPLAVDAYLRGDKATRQSLSDGVFPKQAVEDIYSVTARAEKYGGKPLTEQDIQTMTDVLGYAPQKLAKYQGNTAVKSTQHNQNTQDFADLNNAQLIQNGNGTFTTNNPLLNKIMQIESSGNTNAVSPTGAKGLFQFTSGTGSQYGLVDKAKGIDNRADPQANFEAMKKLTNDNIKALQKNGIPVTPASVYMAHQQGIGGTMAIYKAAQNGTEVPANIRANMDVNGGKGLTPQQFIARWENKVNGVSGGNDLLANASMLGPLENNQANQIEQVNSVEQATRDSVSASTAEELANGQAETTETEVSQPMESTKALASVDWTKVAKAIFSEEDNDELSVPNNVKSAIRGVLKGV